MAWFKRSEPEVIADERRPLDRLIDGAFGYMGGATPGDAADRDARARNAVEFARVILGPLGGAEALLEAPDGDAEVPAPRAVPPQAIPATGPLPPRRSLRERDLQASRARLEAELESAKLNGATH